MVPAWILLFGLAVCTCFLGLYALWSEPENHLIPEVLEKVRKHYAGFTSALGLPNDRLARALIKQAPTNVHPPLVSSKLVDFAKSVFRPACLHRRLLSMA